jgi:hypothetical protein
MSERQSEVKLKKWKNKALERQLENKKLKRRLQEVTQSRDAWKHKYQSLRKANNQGNLLGAKAFGHQYFVSVVLFIVLLQQYGQMSLRCCRHCMICLSFIGLILRVPSHSSIRNWVCKCGYYRVHKRNDLSASYVLYADESISFGSEKILLILGISSDKIPVGRSVQHSDVEVLYVGIGQSWTGETIGAELAKVSTKTQISYLVSDEGSNLKKAYQLGDYVHISDCTHILSNILKGFYQKDAHFEAFRSAVGKVRQSFYLSKEKSRFLPPTLRGKLRFINIFPCVEWAKKCLATWENLPEKTRQSLAFLQTQQDFIEELSEQGIIFKKVCEILKNKAFSTSSKNKIVQELTQFGKTERARSFIQKIQIYLETLEQKLQHLNLQTCLCCSDIIESCFGKFKQKINPNNKNQLSEFVYTLANFTQDFDAKEVKMALENVKIKDLKITTSKSKTG